MKFQRLKSKKKYFLYTLILGVVFLIVVFQTSRASYRTTQSVNVANGTINYKLPDLRMVAIKLQSSSGSSTYTDSNTVPTSGYALNTTLSVCGQPDGNGYAIKDNSITITYDSGALTFVGLKKNTRCYLYFDIVPTASEQIIADNIVTAGSTSITSTSTTNEGIKYVADGMYGGNTYYYRGAVSNNWVKFGKYSNDYPNTYVGWYSSTSSLYKEYSTIEECQNASTYNVNCTDISNTGKDIYWRIIRINGDGSIRMIYSGTTPPTSSTATVMTGLGTQLKKGAYNSTYNDAIYVGWKYTANNGHGTGTSSTIRSYLVGDDGNSGWYKSSGLSLYASYLADGKFCNDRATNGSYFSEYTGTTGYGAVGTAFSALTRILDPSWNRKNPQTFTTACSDSDDIFIEKVGLITIDEALMAGGSRNNANSSYYLYSNVDFWTMTPERYNSLNSFVYVSEIYGTGAIGSGPIHSSVGYRPVINLKAGTTFTGSGTYDDVYKVVGTND